MADEKPKFVLKYFDFQGRAEPIRYIFAHAGVEYVDERVPVERWAELKKSFPFGVLPVLELGGAHVLAGSTAIARYLAERYGLAAADGNALDNARIFSVVDALTAAFELVGKPLAEKDEVAIEKVTESSLPQCLGNFERLISEHGFVHGDRVTYADFYLQILWDGVVKKYYAKAAAQFPKLNQHSQKIRSLPAIAHWLQTRPQCKFSYSFD